jgi:hypothetical protein
MPDLLEGIKTISTQSSGLKTLSVSILGSTVLAIVSTSFVKPLTSRGKLIYLLFIPGWILSTVSIYNSILIERRMLAAVLVKNEYLLPIMMNINNEYSKQLTTFAASIIFYTTWLVAYLVWWLYGEKQNEKL